MFASIAGNTVDEYVKIADKLRTGGRGITGVEINISCPNLEDRNNMFSHSAESTAAVVAGVRKALPKTALFPEAVAERDLAHRDRRGSHRGGSRRSLADQHALRHGD